MTVSEWYTIQDFDILEYNDELILVIDAKELKSGSFLYRKFSDNLNETMIGCSGLMGFYEFPLL